MFEDALPEKVKSLLIKIKPIVNGEKFYLAGGTGLALQIGHRISEDLDFFRGTPFDPNTLYLRLKQNTISSEEVMIESHTLLAIIDGVRSSFFLYEVPLIFKPVVYEGLKLADWRDIVAEKFKTISQRGSKKDFYDIFVVMNSKRLSVEEAVSTFKKRFESTGLNMYHVLRSLTYFEDAEGEPDPNMMEGSSLSWDEVKSFFADHIKEFEAFFTK